jgi:hypothetical protein
MPATNSIKIDTLQLLYGKSISIGTTCLAYPATLRDIAGISGPTFFKLLHTVTVNPKDVKADETREAFEYLMSNSEKNELFKLQLEYALSFFLHEEKILILPDIQKIILGELEEDRILDEVNFKDLQTALRRQNWVSSESEVGSNPQDEKARQIAERLRETRAQVEEIKARKKKEVNTDFADLVGSLATASSGLNIMNIWDMPYYAFYDQLQRMQMNEEYHMMMRSLIAGAKIQKNKIKYWIRKIQVTE